MNIKSFLSGLLLRIRGLFVSLPQELKQAAHTAVTITENFKTVIDDPLVDIFTALIPGTIDDNLVKFLRKRLPAIVSQLRLVDGSLTQKSPEETLVSAFKTAQSIDGDIKNSFLHDLAVMIVREITAFINGQLTWSDAVYIVEWYYQTQFKSNASSASK